MRSRAFFLGAQGIMNLTETEYGVEGEAITFTDPDCKY